jgi:AraC-like DNA-binding protein
VTRPFLYPLRELTAAWDEELHLRVAQLDEQTVRDVAAARHGTAPELLQMTGTAPATPQLERYWNQVVAFARKVADDEQLFAVDLIRHDLLHTLTGAMLTAFPHSFSDRTASHDAAAGATASVRRAIAYMEEHAGEGITTAQLAAAARLSPRGLQNAFQRQLGTSPVAYLRRVRLEGARRHLLAADPTRGATVAGIARRWGFVQLGRFATSYREAYDEYPAHTLSH